MGITNRKFNFNSTYVKPYGYKISHHEFTSWGNVHTYLTFALKSKYWVEWIITYKQMFMLIPTFAVSELSPHASHFELKIFEFY